MARMDDIFSRAKNVAGVAGQKTSSLVGSVRMRVEMANTEKQISAAYEGMGRLIADAARNGNDEDIWTLIETCLASIDELQGEYAEKRRSFYLSKNCQICAACDTVNETDALFCKHCGIAFPEKETETEAEAEAVEAEAAEAEAEAEPEAKTEDAE